MARTYKRDSRGRFAGASGGSSRGGGRKPLQRGTNRLTRDNAGRITSVGGDGATARGGRLRTASGKQRATVTARGIGKAPAGTVGRSGRVKGAARVKAKPALKRTGQQRRIARPQPPKPTKEDRAIEKVKNLKVASQIGGRNKLTFVPDKALTPARRKALGLGSFATQSESQRYSVTRQMLGSQSGVAISERSAYQARLPKPRQGVIKGITSRKAVKSAAKPAAAAKPARVKAKPVAAAKPQNPAQIAGQRRRASETPEKSAQRRLERVRFREGQLQEKRRQLESSLNRRRGKLEGDQRRKATMDLRKTKISLDRISGARQQYENTVKQRQNERNWNIAARSRMQAPSNDRTARNRLNMLRRRVSFLSKNEPRRYDAQGLAYAGNKLAKARKDLSAAAFSVPGQRISFRSRSRAIAAQRSKAQKNLGTARTRGTMRNPAESQRSGIMSRISIGTAKQGNLLTGAFTKQRTGRPRPRR